MGLDCSHGAWTGSCGAFNRWRDKLAEVADYTFSNIGSIDQLVQIDWGNIEKYIGRDLLGKWSFMPVRPDGTPDPLIILLAHSDHKGELQVEYLEAIASRLEELLPKVDGVDGLGHIGDFGEKTRKFITGLRLAASQNEPLDFH